MSYDRRIHGGPFDMEIDMELALKTKKRINQLLNKKKLMTVYRLNKIKRLKEQNK